MGEDEIQYRLPNDDDADAESIDEVPVGLGDAPTFEALTCPKCGADLEVPEGIHTLRCKYCGSSLRLKESGSVRGLALIEEKLDRVLETSERTEKKVDGLVEDRNRVRKTWQEEHDRLHAECRQARNDLRRSYDDDRQRLEATWRERKAELTAERDEVGKLHVELLRIAETSRSRESMTWWAGGFGVFAIPAVAATFAYPLSRSGPTTILVFFGVLIVVYAIRALVLKNLDAEAKSAEHEVYLKKARLSKLDTSLEDGADRYERQTDDLKTAYEAELVEIEEHCREALEKWDLKRPL